MKIYTTEEYLTKIYAQAATGPTVTLEKRKLKAAIQGEITAVERQNVDGKAVMVLYLREVSGDEYGVIMSRQMADDLTSMLGPHPLVTEFFNLN